jgi:hypothetical protein
MRSNFPKGAKRSPSRSNRLIESCRNSSRTRFGKRASTTGVRRRKAWASAFLSCSKSTTSRETGISSTSWKSSNNSWAGPAASESTRTGSRDPVRRASNAFNCRLTRSFRKRTALQQMASEKARPMERAKRVDPSKNRS